MSHITLYTYWRSSCSYRVRIALALKGLRYESVAVNLIERENLADAHAARSATAYVPLLVIDGKRSIESVAIVELLDELYPEPALFPQGAWERARVRALVEIVNSGTQPLQNTSVLRRVADDARDEWARHFIDKGLAAFERLMTENEAHGVRGSFAYGDTITAADVFLVPQVFNAQRFQVDLRAMPKVVAAAAAAAREPAFVAALPENQADAPK